MIIIISKNIKRNENVNIHKSLLNVNKMAKNMWIKELSFKIIKNLNNNY